MSQTRPRDLMKVLCIFYLILFIFPSVQLPAQDKQVSDSLRACIHQDSSISCLLSLAKEWIINPDTASVYLDAAQSRAFRNDDSLSIAFSFLYRAMLAERKADFENAHALLTQSYAFSLHSSSPVLQSEQAAEFAILQLRGGNAEGAILHIDQTLSQPFCNAPAIRLPLLLAGNMICFRSMNLGKSLKYSSEAESLLDLSTPPRIQAQVFNNLGTLYMHLGQPDLSACYLEAALDIRRRTHDLNGEAYCLSNLSILHNRTGNTKEAIRLTKLVIAHSNQSGDSIMLATSCMNMGQYFRKTGNVDTAMAYYDLSWQIFLGKGREEEAASVLNSKALLLQDAGDLTGSLTMFFKALNLAREKNRLDIAGLCHTNIARLLQELGMIEEGRSHATTALKLLSSTEDQHFKGGLYREIGLFHLLENRFETANYCFQTAIQIAEKTRNKTLEAEGWLDLSKVSLQKGDYPTAYSQISKAADIADGSGNRKLIAQIWGVQSKVNWHLGHHAEARNFGKKWVQGAKFDGQITELAEALEFHSFILGHSGDYSQAYPLAKRAAILKDSIAGAVQKRTLASLQSLYNLREKQLTIRSLEDDLMRSELELERNDLRAQRAQLYFIAGSLLFLLLALVLFFLFRRKMLARKSENLQLQLAAAEQRTHFEEQLRAIQQQALQTRMNPHFTFNCLNSIQACILRQDQESATLYLTQFSRLVRLAFEYSGADRITVEKEIAFLTLYCQLENLRFNDRVTILFSIADDLDPELALVPPMVIQPIVENAFQHGFTHEIDSPTLKISVTFDEAFQTWTVQDNGIGPSEPEPNKFGVYRTPSGLAQTRERLELLTRGSSKGENLLKIQQLTDDQGNISGTLVTVRLPV